MVLFGIAGFVHLAEARGGPGPIPTTGITPQVTTSGIQVPQPPPLPIPQVATTTHGFAVTGLIQDAGVSDGSSGAPASNCPDLPTSQQGGFVVLNGLRIVIPCNTILQMPAATLSWAEMLDKARFTLPLSLAAITPPTAAAPSLQSIEITVVGNLVDGRYIAGLVYVSQEFLNRGQGYISGFDYAAGAIIVDNRVRLQLNDPPVGAPVVGGRFSAGLSPDERFSVDNQNPTVRAATGYPMCVPRKDPSAGIDPRCPQKNRPLGPTCRNFADAGFSLPTGRELAPPTGTYCSAFVMKAPPGTPPSSTLLASWIATAADPDSREQAPLVVGDHINYSGTLLRGDGKGPGGSDTISIHSLEADVGIFTQPGTLPVYLSIGEFGVGADAPLAFNNVPQEPQNRIFLEGRVTDVLSIVDIYLVDLNPSTGKESQRWITPASMTGGVGGVGSTGVFIDGGITTQRDGPLPGRVRIRATKANPGILISPTRYIRIVARSLCDPANINGTAALAGASAGAAPVPCLRRAPAANGLFTGQYLAPNFNFIFPENVVPGDPIVPNNLWALGFLVNGEGPGTGPLVPKPW